MKRKLLLSSPKFPQKLMNISIPILDNDERILFVENKIMSSINSYNPKLLITEIEYVKIKSRFPNFYDGSFTGAIIEELEISEPEKIKYEDGDFYIFSINNKWYVQKLLVYVFLSDYDELGRDIIAQSIFPEIIDYMKDYIASPSYTVANHPIYYLNIMNKQITAVSIINAFALLINANINFIEVFYESIKVDEVPSNILEFLQKYETDIVASPSTIVTDYYHLDFINKIFTIKTNKLVLGDFLIENNLGIYDFKGSSEKFYWMKLYPLITMAVRNDYKIEYRYLSNFYSSKVNKFSPNSKKIVRFKYFLDYIEKINKK